MIKNKLSILAILMLFTCTAAGTYENSALQAMIEAWPQVSTEMIRMLTTLPSFISMIVMIAIGQVVGWKIKFKTCVVFGLTCIIIGGLVPFFYHPSWFFILCCRTLLGVGVGCATLGNPLLMRSVPKQNLAHYIGLGSVISSVVNVLINPLVGMLCRFGWQYAFLANILSIFLFILTVCFLQEPQASKKHPQKANKEALPKTVYFFILCQFFATMVLYPLLSGISSYLVGIGFSDSAIAGYMLSIYTGGGIAANLFLAKIQKICGRYTLPIACLMVVLGQILILFVQNIILIMIGIFLSGIGFAMFMATFQVYIGWISTAAQMARASTLVLAANQCGVFLSTFFIPLTTSLGLFKLDIANTFFICLLTYVLLGIILLALGRVLLPDIQK